MKKSSRKKATLEFHWSKEAQKVDEEWEKKKNNSHREKKIRHVEDYIDFLEDIQPGIPPKTQREIISKQFTFF